MKLTKLIDNYPKLSSIEIVKLIANKSISGLWLTENDHKRAKKVINKDILTENVANTLLDEFDINRQYNYNFWLMFN